MKKYEVLSPVGDIENFYVAIKAGADAVYLGLPKYNARMRADNISLDNLSSLVFFAHTKDVKVYITLNTIVSDSEIADIVELVGKCLEAGVDAFIVQDMGLIYVLKSVYPDIVLHGSTQMGVHNVRGARVAKSLGLARIVLSRECTLEDIREISQNVDIELEVFVQGAMCVCFSGNCYLSSIKHNSSGNRGECKQLCRLPYTMSDSRTEKSGYILSPRDNCMLEYLQDLCDAGVCSFKIEGRLRHAGYVGITTNVYREAIDKITDGKSIDIDKYKDILSRVFARGEFVTGYNDTRNVIDAKNNNHMGRLIGKVISCTPFKNIYKISIQSTVSINSGDGLKFLNGNVEISMGVGNIEKNGNNHVVYGKNYIKTGSKVYKSLDSQLENNIKDYSRKTNVQIKCEALVGNALRVEYIIGGISYGAKGDICEPARTQAMTEESISKQLSKIDRELYCIESVDIVTDGVFVAVSSLNELRRIVMSQYESKPYNVKRLPMPEVLTRTTSFDSLCLVDENADISLLFNQYDACILSPSVYSVDVINSFLSKYKSVFKAPLFLNLPIIARHQDLKVIDAIVDKFKSDNVIFIANNIYAFDYINSGAKIWAGSNLNIMNSYSASKYLSMGAEEIISSIEKWAPRLNDTYKLAGNNVLMTLTTCPLQTLYNSDCASCKYSCPLSLTSNNQTYTLRRYRICNCYYELVDNRKSDNGDIVDLR